MMITQEQVNMEVDSATAELGLVLMDLSLRIIAMDEGAASILDYRSRNDGKPLEAPGVPPEIAAIVRSRRPADLASLKSHFRIGTTEYVCRSYLVESETGPLAQPIVALHLQRVSSANQAIVEVGAKYNLTEREQQALQAIAMGLTSKEVAERMDISPNTVKAFLRLIMIKMGVTTRGAIVANILDRTTGTQRTDGSENYPEDLDFEDASEPNRVARHNATL
jgi:DNA-binding CsgD family transcriptional regulator